MYYLPIHRGIDIRIKKMKCSVFSPTASRENRV